VNYIGSKMRLAKSFIVPIVKSVCGNDLSGKIFCDMFAGTGIVGRTFKPLVQKVIANDIEYYAYVLNKHYIACSQKLTYGEELIDELNTLVQNTLSLKTDGFIYQNYCIGGGSLRQYFSDANGKKIDTIRSIIEEWQKSGRIDEGIYYFLLASLLEATDKVANTASIYGAYLKHLKKSAQKPLILKPLVCEVDEGSLQLNEVFNLDASHLIMHTQGDILYLDPPYNTRQYGANYHILNTIARYSPFIPQGKTGLPKYFRSKYCSVFTVKEACEHLIKNACFKYIFLSYNNEGLLCHDDIKKIMSAYGRYDVRCTEYQRFKADANRVNRARSTMEYLHILQKD